MLVNHIDWTFPNTGTGKEVLAVLGWGAGPEEISNNQRASIAGESLSCSPRPPRPGMHNAPGTRSRESAWILVERWNRGDDVTYKTPLPKKRTCRRSKRKSRARDYGRALDYQARSSLCRLQVATREQMEGLRGVATAHSASQTSAAKIMAIVIDGGTNGTEVDAGEPETQGQASTRDASDKMHNDDAQTVRTEQTMQTEQTDMMHNDDVQTEPIEQTEPGADDAQQVKDVEPMYELRSGRMVEMEVFYDIRLEITADDLLDEMTEVAASNAILEKTVDSILDEIMLESTVDDILDEATVAASLPPVEYGFALFRLRKSITRQVLEPTSCCAVLLLLAVHFGWLAAVVVGQLSFVLCGYGFIGGFVNLVLSSIVVLWWLGPWFYGPVIGLFALYCIVSGVFFPDDTEENSS